MAEGENEEKAEKHPRSERSKVRQTAVSYARGMAGGLIVAAPTLYTMETWWAGFHLPPGRLVVLAVVNFGILLILQHFSGLHPRKTIGSQVRAAFVAYGIGVLVSLGVLFAMNVMRPGMALRDAAGKLVLEAVAVGIGASLAMSEFGAESKKAEERKERGGFWSEMAMAAAGAMLFAEQVGHTEEMIMITSQLSWAHAAALLVISMVLVYAVVFAVEKKRKPRRGARRKRHWWEHFLGETVATYAVALLIAGYLLWTFGWIGSGLGLTASVYMIIVLGFPASLGAAAGELLI